MSCHCSWQSSKYFILIILWNPQNNHICQMPSLLSLYRWKLNQDKAYYEEYTTQLLEVAPLKKERCKREVKGKHLSISISFLFSSFISCLEKLVNGHKLNISERKRVEIKDKKKVMGLRLHLYSTVREK